nr:zinc-binding dehydrogenase [Actinoplanes humidus]
MELTGAADRVVTIADPRAAECGVVFTTGTEGRAWHALADAALLHERGDFSLPVERTFALAEGPAAHRLSELGHVRGKLVIVLDL